MINSHNPGSFEGTWGGDPVDKSCCTPGVTAHLLNGEKFSTCPLIPEESVVYLWHMGRIQPCLAFRPAEVLLLLNTDVIGNKCKNPLSLPPAVSIQFKKMIKKDRSMKPLSVARYLIASGLL